MDLVDSYFQQEVLKEGYFTAPQWCSTLYIAYMLPNLQAMKEINYNIALGQLEAHLLSSVQH